VLSSSVVFFAGMCTCNLYKVTSRPWLESVAYGCALAIAVATALTEHAAAPGLLLAAGIVMLGFGLAAPLQPFHRPRRPGIGDDPGA